MPQNRRKIKKGIKYTYYNALPDIVRSASYVILILLVVYIVQYFNYG